MRQFELGGPAGQREPHRLAGEPQRGRDAARYCGRGHGEGLRTAFRGVQSGGCLDDESTSHVSQHRIPVMVTEIGFVSLLVAGMGALAGGLIYLAVRVSRGRW
ncbi:hypothetical protein GCM10022255_020880 [Dactylosporangium darangshiense]|uniref:Uncharacterized protein n=2 Tax=Dactylosporangium TaxID=35753 RepID=A0ABP8D404_9ACTN